MKLKGNLRSTILSILSEGEQGDLFWQRVARAKSKGPAHQRMWEALWKYGGASSLPLFTRDGQRKALDLRTPDAPQSASIRGQAPHAALEGPGEKPVLLFASSDDGVLGGCYP